MLGHVNLSAYATDANELRELWDKDLKKCIKRRRVYEVLAAIWVIARLFDFVNPSIEVFLAVLLALVYVAIQQFVDESNVNYLMHGWDMREALRYFEQTEQLRRERERERIISGN